MGLISEVLLSKKILHIPIDDRFAPVPDDSVVALEEEAFKQGYMLVGRIGPFTKPIFFPADFWGLGKGRDYCCALDGEMGEPLVTSSIDDVKNKPYKTLLLMEDPIHRDVLLGKNKNPHFYKDFNFHIFRLYARQFAPASPEDSLPEIIQEFTLQNPAQTNSSDQYWADKGSCGAVSSRFARKAQHRFGISSEVVTYAYQGISSSADSLSWREFHQVARVGNTIVDFTAGQFNPRAPQPRPVIFSLGEPVPSSISDAISIYEGVPFVEKGYLKFETKEGYVRGNPNIPHEQFGEY